MTISRLAAVESLSGISRGRPFGGVMTLVSNKLRALTETIVCEERFILITVANVSKHQRNWK